MFRLIAFFGAVTLTNAAAGQFLGLTADVYAIEWKTYWNTTTGCIESNQVIDACEVYALDGRLLKSQQNGCLDAFPFLTGDSFHIVRLHSGGEVKTIKMLFGR